MCPRVLVPFGRGGGGGLFFRLIKINMNTETEKSPDPENTVSDHVRIFNLPYYVVKEVQHSC